MTVLTKRKVKRFLLLFFLTLLVMIFLYQIVVFFSKIPDFLKEKSPPQYIFLYYLTTSPSLMIKLYPLIILIALSLLLGEMEEKKEILTLYTSGISTWRWSYSLVISTFFITLLLSSLTLLYLPSLETLSFRLWKGKIQKKADIWEMQEEKKGIAGKNGEVIFIYRLSTKEGKIEGVEVIFPKLQERWVVEEGKWKNGKWILKNIIIRDLTTGKEREINLKTVDFLPSPLELWKMDKPISLWTLKELKNGKEKLHQAEFLHRILFPWGGMIIILFSLPLLSRSLSSKGYHILHTFYSGMGFYATYYATRSMVERGILPAYLSFTVFLSFWISLIIISWIKK